MMKPCCGFFPDLETLCWNWKRRYDFRSDEMDGLMKNAAAEIGLQHIKKPLTQV